MTVETKTAYFTNFCRIFSLPRTNRWTGGPTDYTSALKGTGSTSCKRAHPQTLTRTLQTLKGSGSSNCSFSWEVLVFQVGSNEKQMLNSNIYYFVWQNVQLQKWCVVTTPSSTSKYPKTPLTSTPGQSVWHRDPNLPQLPNSVPESLRLSFTFIPSSPSSASSLFLLNYTSCHFHPPARSSIPPPPPCSHSPPSECHRINTHWSFMRIGHPLLFHNKMCTVEEKWQKAKMHES